MKSFFARHKELFSIALTVVCSVLVVAFVVSAATTIGLNITTEGALTVSGVSTLGVTSSTKLSSNTLDVGGTATTSISAAGNLSVAGTATFAGTVKPSANATKDIGVYGTAWANVYASSTIAAFGGMDATTTLNFGSAGSVGKGTCIVLSGSDGVTYYLSVTSTGAAGPLYPTTVSCL